MFCCPIVAVSLYFWFASSYASLRNQTLNSKNYTTVCAEKLLNKITSPLLKSFMMNDIPFWPLKKILTRISLFLRILWVITNEVYGILNVT